MFKFVGIAQVMTVFLAQYAEIARIMETERHINIKIIKEKEAEEEIMHISHSPNNKGTKPKP